MEFERQLTLLEARLMMEINRPNTVYVTQTQLDAKLERIQDKIDSRIMNMQTTLDKKIDDGGAYIHTREHKINDDLHSIGLRVAVVSTQLATLIEGTGLVEVLKKRASDGI